MNLDAAADAPITESDIEQDAPASTSVMEHAKQFGPGAERREPEPEPDPLKPIRPVDQQKRDQGKFAEGRRPMKAKDAVERINQLTARAKTAEEGWGADKQRLQAAEGELARLRAGGGTQAQIVKAEAKVEQAERRVDAPSTGKGAVAFSEPEPTEDDPKFAGDYGKYLRAAAAWEGRKAWHDAEQGKAQQAEQARVQEANQKTLNSWGERVVASKQLHADFDHLLRTSRVPWQQGDAIDAFIMEDDAGSEVLYHLLTHPDEAGSLVSMPVLKQVKHLSLLSQRLLPPPNPSDTAGTTRAAAGRHTIVLPPKPPTLVRTEAQRASDSPPPTDGTLSVMGHAKHFRRP